MKAASGTSMGLQPGGQGGVSIWTMTLTRQQEYVVNLGAAIWPSGGFAPNAANGAGGGGSFFYRGGELLVACGGGSGASSGDINDPTAGSGGGIGPNTGSSPTPAPIPSSPPAFKGPFDPPPPPPHATNNSPPR